MRKLPEWFRSHPMISILLALIALAVGAHFILNWRAERRWQAYAEAARARGVKLYLTDFAPPKIPESENFAALPMMRAMFKPGARSPMTLPETPGGIPGPMKGERFDWEKWQIFFKEAGFISETTDSSPRDVLHALEHYAPQFQEWSEWKTRTRCRFDLDLKAGSAMDLSHLNLFQNAAKLFSLRMRAHLALGDSSAAYDDFREGFQAYCALVEEPTLISGLVRVSALAILVSGIGDGLADHAWSETELLKLEADLATVRVWEGFRLSMSSERGFENWLHETCIAASGRNRMKFVSGLQSFGGVGGPPSAVGATLMACIPNRVFRDGQLRSNQYFDELLAAVNTAGTHFDFDCPTPSSPGNLSGFDNVYFFLFHLSAPVYGSMVKRFAFTQINLDQTRLAIAIERFRIARGVLPETLTELAPAFITVLPDDIYSGKPMVYRREMTASDFINRLPQDSFTRQSAIDRRKEEGAFLLYSVGSNRSDDGGARDSDGASRHSDTKQPDWVWPYSPGR